jgi:hypothetical protein
MMNKQLGYFCIGLLSGAILMFGFHNALLKRERTFGVLQETIQQVMEARLLNQGKYEILDNLLERNLQQRAMMAMEARLPSRDRVIAYVGNYYEFTGKTPPEDLQLALESNGVTFTTDMLDKHLGTIQLAMENPELTREELKALFDANKESASEVSEETDSTLTE